MHLQWWGVQESLLVGDNIIEIGMENTMSERFSNLAPIKTKEVEDDDPWKIKIVLTEEDVEKGRFYKFLDNKDAEENILKHWPDIIIKRATIDDIKMDVQDLDTDSQHQVNFRIYRNKHSSPYSYAIQGLWRRNFIQRRQLRAGDEIGLCFNPIPFGLRFRLLKPAHHHR